MVGAVSLVVLGLIAAVVSPAGCQSDGADKEKEKPPPAVAISNALKRDGVAVRNGRPISLCGGGSAQVIGVEGRQAIAAWERARGLTLETLRWPVIIGGDADLQALRETLQFNCDNGSRPEQVLKEADRIDAEKLLERRRAKVGIKRQELAAKEPLQSPGYVNGWFTSHTDLRTGEPLPRVWLALLPSGHGWRAPALLMFGGWNDSPTPAEHVALHHYWNEVYGAEIVAMTSHVIETRVEHPPNDDEYAIEVARQQFIYAPDIVWQGTDNLRTLAAGLVNANVWYFWWD